MRPTAGNAALRPAQNSSRSSSELDSAAGHRTALHGDVLDPLQEMIDLVLRSVELDNQQRLDVERIAGVDEFFGRGNRRPIHHLHPGRNNARADDLGDARSAILGRIEADEGSARALRPFQDTHGDFGDDAEKALGAGDDAEQIVAGGIEMPAAKPQNLACHQHQLTAENIVGGHAVFEAMHAAGILRDIAADAAGDLRRRIGRVIEALLLDRLRHRQIGDARLDHGDAIVVVDLADMVEFAEAEEDAVAERQRAARQRSAGAARHDLDALLVAIGENGRDLRRGLRQYHHHGQLPIGGQPVAFERPHPLFGGDDAFARHDALEGRDNLAAALEHRLVEERHHDRH